MLLWCMWSIWLLYILAKSYKELKEYQFYSNNLKGCIKLFNKIMGGRVNETRD